MEPQIFVDKLNFNDGYEMTIGHSDIIIYVGEASTKGDECRGDEDGED